MRSVCATLLVSLISSEAVAQNGLQWFVGAGPSVVSQRGYSILSSDPFAIQSSDTLLLGAVDGRGMALLGVARRLGGSALNLRIDVTYSRSTSPDGRAVWPWGLITRSALHEGKLGLLGGFEWNALPSSRWSPYIVTTVGAYQSRLAWNVDSTKTEANRSTRSHAVAAQVGFGIKAVLFGTNLFAESRREWWSSNWNDSRTIPLIVGIRLP